MKIFHSINPLRWLLLNTLIGVGIGACSVGPDFKPPPEPISNSFTREPNAFDQNGIALMAIDSQWWRAYGSPELNQLVELALEHNPSIDLAVSNLTIAKQNVIAQQGFSFLKLEPGTLLHARTSAQH